MIIGNGLIARSFIDFKNQEDKVIFASGVSNSLEENLLEYKREENLLLNIIKNNKNKKIIYFSTTSIFNIKSIYTNHKIKIEDIIKTNAEKYCIYRLPQIIGKGGNKTNLINFLVKSIRDTRNIFIYPESLRSLLDVEDLVHICQKTCDIKDKNILNIAGIEFVKIEEIINLISEKIDIKPILSFYRDRQEYFNENSVEIDSAIKELNISSSNYTKKVIQKYL